MDTELIEKIEGVDKTYLDSDINDLPPSDIIAYNELRSCADLYRMYHDGVLDVNPDFQRDEIWSEAQKTRFIDSLIKKLPIPSMCFSLDYKTEKWQVIDGLQRISSIIHFLDENSIWRLSILTDVDERLSGKFVSDIKKIDKGILYSRLANLTIPVTVLRCDYTKKSHTNYLFTIFHRLNTGGVKLTNQEIRNAIYNGSFNSLLKDCNKYPNWRKLLGLKAGKSYRQSKEELILRFFAFTENLGKYDGTLSRFLNDYMNENRNPPTNWLNEKYRLFEESVDIIFVKIADKKTIAKSSNVFVEALLFGIGKNLNWLRSQNSITLKEYFSRLKKDENFSEDNLKEALASKSKVTKRLGAAQKTFSGN